MRSKDILVFNKQGGVGLECAPIGDCLTFAAGTAHLPLYDRNGNRTVFDTPSSPDLKEVYTEPFNTDLEGFNSISVSTGKFLYLFRVFDSDFALYIDVPLDKFDKISLSKDYVKTLGIVQVIVDNTEALPITIHCKNFEYTEVQL